MSLADCALMGPVHAHYWTELVSRRLLLETALPVIRWIEFYNAPGAEAPRTIGSAESELRGSPIKRSAQCYALWMLQRVLDPYRALPEVERARVDSVLAGTGWEPLLAYLPRHRVGKHGFKPGFAEIG